MYKERPAPGIPPHGGTSGAGKPRHRCGRPSVGRELEGRACSQARGWGECPHGQEVTRAGRASLSASSARMTSCPHRCPQTPLMHNICKRGQKKYTSKKVAKGRGHRRGHSPHGGESRCRAIEAGVGFLPDLPPPPAKESAHALTRGLTAKEKNKKEENQEVLRTSS